MKHLLVSRLAIKWNHPNQKLEWNEWLLNRLDLFNNITRQSIKNQTDQDFTLLTLIDESVAFSDVDLESKLLDNEVSLIVPQENDYPWNGITNAVKDYINSLEEPFDDVIITRIDSDDFLHEDFVHEVKNIFNTHPKLSYVDIADSLTYNIKTGCVFKSDKYINIISPFVSVREKTVDFKCLAYAMEHRKIGGCLSGVKSKKVNAIQAIHNNNLINKQTGKDITANFKFKEYGRYFK